MEQEIIEEKKISLTEHNKVVDYHIRQLKDAEERLEIVRLKMQEEINNIKETNRLQYNEYILKTPERLRRINAEQLDKIMNLTDMINDKDDYIALLREEIKTLKSDSDIERRRLEDIVEEKDYEMEQLKEQIKKKNVLIKKYSRK